MGKTTRRRDDGCAGSASERKILERALSRGEITGFIPDFWSFAGRIVGVMVAFLLALALAPWAHPLSFHSRAGWQTGMSGDRHSLYSGGGGGWESSAWMAINVPYRDRATADPPNETLAHLPAHGIVVWAVIYTPVASNPPAGAIRLDLSTARHLKCCDGPGTVVGGDYELTGHGPSHAYSVIVRVFFGSRPTKVLVAHAQQALNRLRLPAER